ncbi:MAG: hypothetical protein CMJ52_09135 [Planctomycetaceae bacterium]|nr:hypothetical protein [Planctomycetaceae bacterium]
MNDTGRDRSSGRYRHPRIGVSMLRTTEPTIGSRRSRVWWNLHRFEIEGNHQPASTSRRGGLSLTDARPGLGRSTA